MGILSARWVFYFERHMRYTALNAIIGFVSGSLLFVFLGIIAFYTGMQLWYMYLKLDSEKYPVHNYGDLTERIYGRIARHGINVLQSIQLLFNVAVIICKRSNSNLSAAVLTLFFL